MFRTAAVADGLATDPGWVVWESGIVAVDRDESDCDAHCDGICARAGLAVLLRESSPWTLAPAVVWPVLVRWQDPTRNEWRRQQLWISSHSSLGYHGGTLTWAADGNSWTAPTLAASDEYGIDPIEGTDAAAEAGEGAPRPLGRADLLAWASADRATISWSHHRFAVPAVGRRLLRAVLARGSESPGAPPLEDDPSEWRVPGAFDWRLVRSRDGMLTRNVENLAGFEVGVKASEARADASVASVAVWRSGSRSLGSDGGECRESCPGRCLKADIVVAMVDDAAATGSRRHVFTSLEVEFIVRPGIDRDGYDRVGNGTGEWRRAVGGPERWEYDGREFAAVCAGGGPVTDDVPSAPLGSLPPARLREWARAERAGVRWGDHRLTVPRPARLTLLHVLGTAPGGAR